MKKGKRILAVIGIILLVGLYVTTLVCAIVGTENTMNILMASIYATIVIPAIIWIYEMIYRHAKRNHDENNVTAEEEE